RFSCELIRLRARIASLVRLVARHVFGQDRPRLFATGPIVRVGHEPARVVERAGFDAVEHACAIEDSDAAVRAEPAGLSAPTVRFELERAQLARLELERLRWNDEAHAERATGLALAIAAVTDVQPVDVAIQHVPDVAALASTRLHQDARHS